MSRLSTSLVLIAVAVTSTLVAGVTTGERGHRHLSFCPVTPILPTRDTCAAAGVVFDIYRGAAPPGWQGPHDCMGDYCIYSNRDISKHEWTIFATTQEVGNRLLNQSLLYRVPGSKLASGFPGPFREAAVPGKDLGMIATRAIEKGETIVAEDAIALVHADINRVLPLPERAQLYDLVLENLPVSARAEFFSQIGGEPIYIAALNFFTVLEGDRPSLQSPPLYQGAFPQAARLNHDCRPNAAYHFDAKLAHTIRAVRDIAAGDEITITYTDLLQPRAERQRDLRGAYLFECSCAQCALDDAAAAASDARLERIVELFGILDSPSMEAVTEGLLRPEMGAELVRLFEEERLDAYMWYALRRVALNYAMFGHGKDARAYGARALEALLREQGESHPDIEDFRVLSTKPTKHWIWARARI